MERSPSFKPYRYSGNLSELDVPVGFESYRPLVKYYRKKYKVRVNRWTEELGGCAWQNPHSGEHIVRNIEAPRPCDPLSCCIFLHEVGHHRIGFFTYKRRCEEELKVWDWALKQMNRAGVPVTFDVVERHQLAMDIALTNAKKRGMQELPKTLQRHWLRERWYEIFHGTQEAA